MSLPPLPVVDTLEPRRLMSTSLVDDIRTNPADWGSNPREMVKLNGKLLFFANDGAHGDELWRGDGTTGNTQRVTDIANGPDGLGNANRGSVTGQLVVCGGFAYFGAIDNGNDIELWRTDGTAAGTKKLNVNPNGSSIPERLTDF